MRYYTGVGSRQTPVEVRSLMTAAAFELVCLGFTLRSGGAEGADLAFERGAKKKKEIYCAMDSNAEAEEIAKRIHPAWEACDTLARRLHGRNVFQILGIDFKTPSEFLICWTKDGKAVGGTRTSLMLATEHGIPIYNLAKVGEVARLDEFLNTLKTGIR